MVVDLYHDRSTRRSEKFGLLTHGTPVAHRPFHIHDIEYQGRQHTEWALSEGYDTVCELKREGRIGAVSFGIYPMDVWKRIFSSMDVDAALVHNHYCLNDTQLLDLLPAAREKGIGIINGSPFASGLLTDRNAPPWHPAIPEDQAVFRAAAEFCRNQGVALSQLALQFASQNPDIPTTLFSSANPDSVARNVRWYQEPYDPTLLTAVCKILEPVRNREWNYDSTCLNTHAHAALEGDRLGLRPPAPHSRAG